MDDGKSLAALVRRSMRTTIYGVESSTGYRNPADKLGISVRTAVVSAFSRPR